MTATGTAGERLFETQSDAGCPIANEESLCLDTYSASLASDTINCFSGSLAIDPENLGSDDAGKVLERLAALASWVQAQQARVVNRMEFLLGREVESSLQKPDAALTMSLTAAEAGAVLNTPHMSAMQLVSESAELCTSHTATLTALSRGQISHRHARAVLDQLQDIPRGQSATFEAELLAVATNKTCAQFMRTARRMRERQWPETIRTRHRAALDQRRVSFDPLADGMGEFCARIAVEKGQAIFTALNHAAQGERKNGDLRTLDQLRADIFTSLMLHSGWVPSDGLPPGRAAPDSTPERTPGHALAALSGKEPAAPDRGNNDNAPELHRPDANFVTAESAWDDSTGIKAEILVLISADSLFGQDQSPAELLGVGSISAAAARRLAEQALHWTGLVQDPSTGEILAVGRRRKVPAGLRRWLQARDDTCRFPGCGVGTARTEVDHTRPWASGGLTEHGNLANLCPKHHRYKSLGFWRARQPSPGVLDWTSPMGRVYRTYPQLHYGGASPVSHPTGASELPSNSDPPPF